MSCGKYSPTVSASYSKDQEWWYKHCDEDALYDRDGYDSYGYHHETEKDREGYTEWDYLEGGKWVTYGDEEVYEYPLYNHVLSEWAGKIIGE